MRTTSKLLPVCLCLLGGIAPHSQAGGSVTIESLLREMVDRDAVARFPARDFRLKQHPELVTRLNAAAKEARGDLGKYLQRGSGQRATGSAIAAAPIISHEKDWGTVDAGTSKAIARERQKRYPAEKKERMKRR